MKVAIALLASLVGFSAAAEVKTNSFGLKYLTITAPMGCAGDVALGPELQAIYDYISSSDQGVISGGPVDVDVSTQRIAWHTNAPIDHAQHTNAASMVCTPSGPGSEFKVEFYWLLKTNFDGVNLCGGLVRRGPKYTWFSGSQWRPGVLHIENYHELHTETYAVTSNLFMCLPNQGHLVDICVDQRPVTNYTRKWRYELEKKYVDE